MSQKTIKFLSIDLIDTIDGLNNMSSIYNFMDNLLLELKLKEIFKPVLIPYYYGKVKKDDGISCYAFFEDGYCTLHIFEKRKIAYFDIISNKQTFDKQIVLKKLTQFCGTKNILINSDEERSKPKNKFVFGPHYICSGKTKNALNIDSILCLQEKIIKKICMTPINTPTVLKNKNYTLIFVAIAESHVAIRVSKNNLQVDIFSCKMFDLPKLKNIINKVSNIQKEDIYYRFYKV